MAEEFNEAPLHFLSSKPFRPAPCVTLVAKKAQRLFHWASLSPCCHSRPSHSQPTVPWQKVHLCAGSQSYHGTHGQSCSARPFPNWVLQMGDPSWRPCTITMSPFSRSSRCLWLKHNQAKHCNQHCKHQKGKAALPVTEKQTAQDKLHYRDKIRISFV